MRDIKTYRTQEDNLSILCSPGHDIPESGKKYEYDGQVQNKDEDREQCRAPRQNEDGFGASLLMSFYIGSVSFIIRGS